MLNTPLTRRGAVSRIALGAMLAAVPGTALAAPAPAASPRQMAVAALLQTAFPHGRLTPAYYAGVAATYLNELSGDAAAGKALDAGIAALDGSHIAPFAELPAVIRKSLVQKIDQQPFFKALLWRGAELIYRDPAVWALLGYEGSSVEYGGYRERGFDDIDWLPGSAKKAKPA